MIMKTRNIPDNKLALKNLPITRYVDAQYLYYPITNQRCPEGETCVIFGQFVKVGEEIGTRRGAFFEQPIHATCSGEVLGIEKKYDVAGKLVDCLIIKNDYKYELHESITPRDAETIKNLTREDFINIAKDKGLVGLGGGGFPTYIKLSTDYEIDTILANGIECEPNLISDYALIMSFPEQLIEGLIFAMRAVNAKNGVIAIKHTQSELIKRLDFTLSHYPNHNIKVVAVGSHYPQGWEVEAMRSALGVDVPQGKLPMEYGVLNFNVSTLKSFHTAVVDDLPVLKRYFVLSGEGINPMHFRTRIGTNIQDLIEQSGGYLSPELDKTLILGGPMMGSNVTSDDVVITHTLTSMIIENGISYDEDPCISCAACVYSCPVQIQPVQIMNALKLGDKEFLKDLSVDKCIECGLCSYVCPSKIHLTEYMRQGKRFIK